MADAEKLLNEAQYAFQNIRYSDGGASRRQVARAKSLALKVLRKFPGTNEATVAHSILLRLGDSSYQPLQRTRNIHTHSNSEESKHSHAALRTPVTKSNTQFQSQRDSGENLQWEALVGAIMGLPRWALTFIGVGFFFLFGIFGPFLLLPIIVLIVIGSPLKKMFSPNSRRESDEFVRKINQWLLEEKKRKAGGGN